MIGLFIRQRRLSLGITQQECANALGLKHRASYSKIEADKYDWRLKDFITIAKVLDKEPVELLREYLNEVA